LLSIALVFFCNIWGRGTIIDLNNSQSHQESPKSSCGVLSQFLNIANIAQEGELFPRVICFSWQVATTLNGVFLCYGLIANFHVFI
jgi:hypothetical protein